MRRLKIRVASRTYGKHYDDLDTYEQGRCLELVGEELLTIEEQNIKDSNRLGMI